MYFFILISVFTVQVFAQSPLCENMAEYACAPGRFEDDTGVVRSETEVRERINQYAASQRESIQSEFTRKLSQPSGQFFASKTAAALGLAGSPSCGTQQGLRASACVQQLAQGLTEITLRLNYGLTGEEIRPQVLLSDLEHVAFDENFLSVSRDLYARAQRDLVDQNQVQKIRNEVFPRVRAALIQRLRQMNISDEHRQRMITRIESVQFAGTDCGRPNVTESINAPPAISSLYQPQAFYNAATHTFKYCSGMLMQTTSEFSAAFVIAHELSHSLDPCGITRGPASLVLNYRNTQDLALRDAEYPIPHVLQCLRSERSVGARNITDEQNKLRHQLEAQLKAQQTQAAQNPYAVFNGYYTFPPAQNSQMGVAYPPSPAGVGFVDNSAALTQLPPPQPLDYCNSKDQITESFSDWLAAETLPLALAPNHSRSREQYQNGYANALRTICSLPPPPAPAGTANNTALGGGFSGQATAAQFSSPHPEMSLRINRIILQNPRMRSHMGCSETSRSGVYCDVNNPLPLNTQPGLSGGTAESPSRVSQDHESWLPGRGPLQPPAPQPAPAGPTGVAQ